MAEGGHAQVNSPAGACLFGVELGESVPSPGEADPQTLDFAGPALPFGLVDAGEKVVAGLDELDESGHDGDSAEVSRMRAADQSLALALART
jgi:hypothetical protein